MEFALQADDDQSYHYDDAGRYGQLGFEILFAVYFLLLIGIWYKLWDHLRTGSSYRVLTWYYINLAIFLIVRLVYFSDAFSGHRFTLNVYYALQQVPKIMIFSADTTLAYLWYKINILARFFAIAVNASTRQIRINRALWLLLSASTAYYITFAILMGILSVAVDIKTSLVACALLDVIANVLAWSANIYAGRKLIRFISQAFGEKPTRVVRVMYLISVIILLRAVKGIIFITLSNKLVYQSNHETIGWLFLVLVHYLVLEIVPVLVILVSLARTNENVLNPDQQSRQQQAASSIFNSDYTEFLEQKPDIELLSDAQCGDIICNQKSSNQKMQTYAEKYDEKELIGRGNFGVAQVVNCKADGQKYIAKKILLSNLSTRDRGSACNEVDFLKNLDHPFVVKYVESFKSPDQLVIIMEYWEGGDLANWIKEKNLLSEYLPENQVVQWFAQIASALQHVHSKKILHRDIKASNIYLTASNHAKLGDFGISKGLASTSELAMTIVGTPYYMSPEVCENRPYSNKSDVWALGWLLYEMCSLQHPFVSDNLLGLVYQITRENFKPIPEHYSAYISELLQEMLTKNPNTRISMKDILHKEFVKEAMEKFVSENVTIKHGRRRKGSGSQNGSEAGSPMKASPNRTLKKNTIRSGTKTNPLDLAGTEVQPYGFECRVSTEEVESLFDEDDIPVMHDTLSYSNTFQVRQSTLGLQKESSEDEYSDDFDSYSDDFESYASDEELDISSAVNIFRATINEENDEETSFNLDDSGLDLDRIEEDEDENNETTTTERMSTNQPEHRMSSPDHEDSLSTYPTDALKELNFETQVNPGFGNDAYVRHKNKWLEEMGPTIFEAIYTFIKQEREKKTDDDLIFSALQRTVPLPNVIDYCFLVDQLLFLEN